ncbi:tetratricopeptide repeat protein [bacterium]|nr:tetratricopeptide repeat protein [bacterium]
MGMTCPDYRVRLPLLVLALAMLCACQPAPESEYRAAEGLLARGRTDLAQAKLERLAADCPEFASANLLLGKLHLSRGNFPEAERRLAAGLAGRTGDFDHWIALARARLALEQYPPALEALDCAQAVARGPLEPLMARRWIAETSRLAQLNREMAEVALRFGRFADHVAALDVFAAAAFERFDADLVALINLHLAMIESFTRLNLPTRVESAWNQVFRLNNRRIQELEARLRARPDDLSRRMELASAHLSAAKRWAVVRKNQEKMEEHLLRADPLLSSIIALATETPSLRARAAEGAVSLYLMRNRLDDAELWITKAIEWDAQKPEYRYTRAQIEEQRGRPEAALASMQAYLAEASPTASADAWLFWARLLRGAGRVEEALAAADQAVARASEEFQPRLVRIQLLLSAGRTGPARQAIVELARRDLDPPEMKQLHELQQLLLKLEAVPPPP